MFSVGDVGNVYYELIKTFSQTIDGSIVGIPVYIEPVWVERPIDNPNEWYNWLMFAIGYAEQSYKIAKELIGVVIYWENTDIGALLLIHNSESLSFSFRINTKYIDENAKILDFNWYASRIIPVFNKQYHVFSYNFEYICC